MLVNRNRLRNINKYRKYYRHLEDQKTKKNNFKFPFLVRLTLYTYRIFNEAYEKVIINLKSLIL